jgi:hypothetical protein
MSNTVIIIPEELYLGVRWNKGSIPIGFVTPYGTDAAAKKRMSTVDSWTNNAPKNSKLKNITFKNVLMAGFKLEKSQRRWSTSNVVWKVQDPRGFMFEISSDNLTNILETSTIINGEIIDKCVYGRHRGENVLLTETSPEYKDALNATSASKKSVAIKDVPVGSRVILANGISAIYYGLFYKVYRDVITTSRTSTEKILVDHKKKYVFKIKEKRYTTEVEKLHLFASAKVSVLEEEGSISDIEASSIVNEMIVSGCYIDEGSGSCYNLKALVKEPNPKIIVAEKEITHTELSSFLGKKYHQLPKFFLIYDGKRYMMSDWSKIASNKIGTGVPNRLTTIEETAMVDQFSFSYESNNGMPYRYSNAHVSDISSKVEDDPTVLTYSYFVLHLASKTDNVTFAWG